MKRFKIFYLQMNDVTRLILEKIIKATIGISEIDIQYVPVTKELQIDPSELKEWIIVFVEPTSENSVFYDRTKKLHITPDIRIKQNVFEGANLLLDKGQRLQLLQLFMPYRDKTATPREILRKEFPSLTNEQLNNIFAKNTTFMVTTGEGAITIIPDDYPPPPKYEYLTISELFILTLIRRTFNFSKVEIHGQN